MKAWTREVLSQFVRSKLDGYRLIVVSNREPFQHRRKGEGIECVQPASGMATALDPIMRACGGLWVAHGSGDADQLTVDSFDHVQVPPAEPQYTLRRVWLTPEEEEGYYSGLANQALWPLCHVAFSRPEFNPSHWEMYRCVNRRFADAVLEEAGNDPTFVFIQDYHFGLLPQMLRQSGANLVIAQFWHIPWPNREVFAAFPWREELINGMLGNDLLGFHLPQHCQNFLETVDLSRGWKPAQFLGHPRVDYGRSEVCHGGHCTRLEAFPIGIDFDEHVQVSDGASVATRMQSWRKELHLDGSVRKRLAVGIDRLDYTKGIPERLRFLDRLLEQHAEYRGKLVFVQIAVPSRSSLPAYRQIEEEVDALTEKINGRWSTKSWTPIVLLKRHFNSVDMIALHKLADFAVVTSLHDGMNLVAKEFVASRIDEDGVLVLSKFTGAARELKDALLINPFSVEEGAAAYLAALEMLPAERRHRMRRMREAVEQNNIYCWAGRFIGELAQIEFPAEQPVYPSARAAAAFGVAV